MRTHQQLRSDAATIRMTPKECPDAPLMVHRETLLGELPPRGQNQYILVCNDDQKLIGIVPSREIDRRLLSSNTFERTRWASMPIGAMSSLSLADMQEARCPVAEKEVSCSAIREGDNLFGLAVNGDLFLSWNRLESLFTAALSDPLTGLMNRLAYERRLQEEWARSLRTNNSIGVVVVDLDNFKGVNDTYGHAVGDELLMRVGERLEISMRSYDVVARFGGDEFVALCLGCAPEDIQIPVSRLLNSIADIEIEANGDTIRIEASVGAAVRHCNFDGSLPEELFVAADSCLYEAKRSNENAWRIEYGPCEEPSAEPVSCRVSPKSDSASHNNLSSVMQPEF